MEKIRVGIIGGTGLYEIEGFENKTTHDIDTPYGKPSDSIIVGDLCGEKIAFLPRHGVGHRILPSELPQHANIWALKSLGVEYIIAVSAVGSLRNKIAPKDIVIPDQIIDKTKFRKNTFFGDGFVAHVSMADPFCNKLRKILYESAKTVSCKSHFGGTYVCMEGPNFSTRAESELHRSWGASVIGMTAVPEAQLAREAEICYAMLAMSTDYDCWHEEEADVTSDAVMEIVKENSETAKQIIKEIIKRIPEKRDCSCANSLATSLVTQKKLIPEQTYEKVKLLVGKYM
jgi:5'-methylthioadenosine phosphorylase